MSEMTIPVLPCISLADTLAFYETLGFEVTHQQKTPNVYGAIRRGDINLHFMGIKGLDPATAFSTCLVIVPEVDRLHQTFVDGLCQLYGKVPFSGLPRISRMKKGQSRFTVVDVAGNSVIFIRQDAPDDHDEGVSGPYSNSRLGRALQTAARLRDFKNDDAAAAKVLDVALAKADPASPIDRARAVAARAELALALGDGERARALHAELDQISLSDEERAVICRDLDALEAIERWSR